jgi:hypothetical protein
MLGMGDQAGNPSGLPRSGIEERLDGRGEQFGELAGPPRSGEAAGGAR